jgi:hypothetical protein
VRIQGPIVELIQTCINGSAVESVVHF